ncbi:hypothetical protein [Streptomyces sp. AB3(2024)]|uniref:hypothetical protein n=1 Tax=Streptomyces sp. AB3(2024) TaxID=3317321 RepID=UPI0035A29B6B
MISTVGELLAALEPLPHAARLRYTAVTAHRLSARGRLGPLLTELDALGPYERRLAALAALTAGKPGYLAARLADPDPVVRRYALRGARRLPVPDAAVEAAYEDAPAVVRAGLVRLLRDGRRPGLAERLVPRVRAEYGDRDAARLLAGCSREFTARVLPELAGALAYEDWSALAVRHPGAVLDHAERELDGLPSRSRDLWWRRHATAIAAALPAAPERVLDLLERSGPDGLPGPVHDRLGDLVAVDAERVARWFADPRRAVGRWERTPGRAVMHRLVSADPASLPRLGALWFHRGAFGLLLRSVPPARRPAFVDAVVDAGRPGGNVRAHEGVLARLPAAERHGRARAAVEALRAEGTTDWPLWGSLALLPPAEARPELLAALDTNDADARGTIWERLSVNAGLTGDPVEVATVLALAAGRLANERDPVRQEALSAFDELPVPLLAAALDADPATVSPGTATTVPPSGDRTGADCLERLCRDALRARDCSALSRDTVRSLAVNLLASGDAPGGEHRGATAPRTAVRIIEALTAHTGTVVLRRPGDVSPGGGTRALLDALGPWLDRTAARGDFAPLLALITSFGHHAYRIPELQDRLEQALRTCPDGIFGEAAAAWLADPATRGHRVARLLEREPSAVFLPPVLAVVAAERTDLLDLALTGSPVPGGRFPAAGAPRTLPPFRYADRWLPRQQRDAVRLAADAIADSGRGLDERAALLRAVAPVPAHGRALIQRYAAGAPGPQKAADSPAGRAEAALTSAALTGAALAPAAHTDDPASALAVLLDHAGDDGAVAAWSAAGRAAAHARPSRLAALFHDVLTRERGVKVTVRKAAARLTARHLSPAAAVRLLSTVARTPGTHPDVRVTVLGLAPALLPAEEMWGLLESAVTDGPDAARRALTEPDPTELPAADRPRYGELLARLPFVAEGQAPDLALSVLGDWARYTPAAGAALVDVYTDLASPRRPWRARSALMELARSGLPHPIGGVEPGSLLHDVVDRLLVLIAAGEPEGGGREDDLPARRRLESLVGPAAGDHRTCAALARRLAADPAVTAARTSLLVRAVDLEADAAGLRRSLRGLTAVVEGRPVLAFRVAGDLEEAHRYGPPLADPAAALAAVGDLSGDGDLVRGLLAVGLATALGARQGWPDACRSAVVGLRRHPEQEVREAAYAIVLGGS